MTTNNHGEEVTFEFGLDESVRVVAETQGRFEQLAAEWKRETAHLSSPNAIAQHRAYQEIIGMGERAIPLILRDLQETGEQWFWALNSIAGESPILPGEFGNIEAMTRAWISWGIQRQYIGRVDAGFRRGEFDGSSP